MHYLIRISGNYEGNQCTEVFVLFERQNTHTLCLNIRDCAKLHTVDGFTHTSTDTAEVGVTLSSSDIFNAAATAPFDEVTGAFDLSDQDFLRGLDRLAAKGYLDYSTTKGN